MMPKIFVKRQVRRLIKDNGYDPAKALGAAYSIARWKKYKIVKR